ncbi:MAG: hypothetical protein OXG37_14045 [Actinomycetia bacterium]|nr:hypothetical protein [Actinomycetes bacterium]
MAKPFIPCLDTSTLEWRGGEAYHELSAEFDPGEVEDDTYYDAFAVKVLAFDEKTGAQTKRERYRAGFVHHNYGYHRCNEEVYTLSGRFRYPDSAELFTEGCYVYRPPGWIHNGEVYEDTEVIVRHDALFTMVTGHGEDELRTNVLFDEPAAAVGPRGFVVHRNANFEAWIPGENFLRGQEPWEDSYEGELWVKVLSRDVVTDAQTLIMRLGPGFRFAEPGFLSAGEESYVLAGDITIGEDRLGPAFFTSRPAGYVYGPVESSGGCVLYASFDGPLGRHVATSSEIGTRIGPQ